MIVEIHSKIAWIRTHEYGRGYSLHYPWTKPLFSEGHGYHKPLFKLWGFRVFKLEAYKPLYKEIIR